MLSTKIIVFGIAKAVKRGNITKSSFSKPSFIIFDIRYVMLVQSSDFLYSRIDA